MAAGTQVGAYRIVEQIGEGGMGTVWIAEHMTIGRRAAVKMLHGEYSHRPEIVQRFFNEARAATQISDPGIVQIFDFGTTPTGQAYIVMELLDGEALDRRLQAQGKLTVRDALRIMRQISSTLGAAHARGIVHRDLKPENVFIVRDPEVPGGERAKILDFGIAKLSDNAGLKTQTNAIMGTPQYMSPEQCRGSGAVDARADVYALGCVMCALITGQPPFVAEGHGELIVMHLQQQAPLLSSRAPHVPANVDAVAMKCLAKDPNERYANAGELAQALGMLITSTSQAPAGAMPAHANPTIALPNAERLTVALPNGEKQTTLSGAAAQTGTTMVPSKSKAPLIAVAVLLLVIGGGVAFVATRQSAATPATTTAANDDHPAAPVKPATPPVETPKPPPATAPVETPTPPPAKAVEPPAAPKTVSVSIKSTPPADVFVGDEPTARGKTPYALELAADAAPVSVRLVVKGYEIAKRDVSPTDSDVTIKLVKLASHHATTAAHPATTTTTTPASTEDSDDTMNPFKNNK